MRLMRCGLFSRKRSEAAATAKSGLPSSTSRCFSLTDRIADYLIKNTGARFHNTCTPLFMRRLKEMILVATSSQCLPVDKGKDRRRRQHAPHERRARDGPCLGRGLPSLRIPGQRQGDRRGISGHAARWFLFFFSLTDRHSLPSCCE